MGSTGECHCCGNCGHGDTLPAHPRSDISCMLEHGYFVSDGNTLEGVHSLVHHSEMFTDVLAPLLSLLLL